MHPKITKETILQAKEYVRSKGWEIGRTYRMSHLDCGDKRRRLYITVKTSSEALMWCHNCQHSGFITSCRGPRIKPTIVPSERTKIRYEDMNLEPIVKGHDYFVKYNVSKDTLDLFGVMWDRASVRVHYPIYNHIGSLIGGQLRVVDDGPCAIPNRELKYLTWRENESVSLQQFTWPNVDVRDGLVITEDVLSSLKIRQETTGVDTLPLLTTSIQPDTAYRITNRGYQWILIWLDNDSALVNMATDKIKQLLTLMGNKYVSVIHAPQEPKRTDAEYIKTIIKTRRDSL